MLNKEQIDSYFQSQLQMLRIIIRGVKYKQNKDYISEDALISETYMHCISNQNKLNTENELQKMMVNYANKSLLWTNSKINKQERVTSIIVDDYEVEDDFDIEIEHKLIIEEWYNSKKAILFLYRNQLQDKVAQIIFDCFFEKNIKSGAKLSKHLGISKYATLKYLKDMKKNIRIFAEEYDKNNNI